MEARDLTRPPGLQMHMQQVPAQPSMTAQGSLGAFYNHLRGGTGSFSQQQLLHHQHQQAQQQQQQQQQQRQQAAGSRNPMLPSMIHSPAAMRHSHSHSPNPSPTLHPNVYPPETPPHTIPHPLNVTSSPPSGTGVGMATMSTGIVLSRSDPIKRKRGRPRKYTTDANGIPLPSSSTSPSAKKAGRASAKKTQLSTNGAAGQGFTPHVLTVSAGEDLTAKIMSFLQHGPWAVCILSANGAISNASLRHAGVSSSPVTYEGRFEVLTLSGLFLLSENNGTQSRTGGLSVSLAGAEGRVIGGKVAGLLLAASPVQVVLGTFFPHSRKPQARPESIEDKPLGSETKQEVLPPNVENDITGSALDQTSNSVAIPDKERTCHLMPLQSAADWGGSHFDMETTGHNEQI